MLKSIEAQSEQTYLQREEKESKYRKEAKRLHKEQKRKSNHLTQYCLQKNSIIPPQNSCLTLNS